MTASRRDLFALGGLAALGSISPAEPANFDLRSNALRVSLAFTQGKWQVAIPDFEYMDRPEPWMGWHPGRPLLIKWMPLEEYLAQVEEVCGLRPKAGA